MGEESKPEGKKVCYHLNFGTGALSGKMLVVSIIENNKFDAYPRSGLVNLRLALTRRVRKRMMIGPRRVRAPCRG